ncbi:MAG: C4-dicarboxylic acid transporter DauA [Deltaproteobacteria bacterium]|nr:C4-dicarboxylic acid transporter DauA [Deltaproteobacteria bacterium]MCB9788891.1 C4-dicarboxylic acid transporter DauA [Deltaproteobacteria bacterium]
MGATNGPLATGRGLAALPVATALRAVLREGYDGAAFRADVLAGLVVGVVALPLSMALAVATGVPPQHGLYTAIIGGFTIALLGGSRVQVSGPTAAFVVILAPIVSQFGIGGLLVAGLMAGLILIAMGLARLGQLVQFVPYPVTTGFTAGIAVVIATIQLKDFLGLPIAHLPEDWLGKATAIAMALPATHLPDLAVGALTLATLLAWPRVSRRVPAPLVGLLAGVAAAELLRAFAPGLEVATLDSRFTFTIDGVTGHGIPRLPPLPLAPWHLPGADGRPLVLDVALLRSLAGPALAIAMLGAIESLLSAVIADGMTGRKHDPDAELVAQGVGNVVAPFFGGIAATGAIARTATNIRAGARSPVAAVVHAAAVLAAVLVLAPLLGRLPMASLAALLLLVAWNMSEIGHFTHVLRTAPRSDIAVQLVCFALTVLVDMVAAIAVGLVLASFLFMHRMIAVSGARLVDPEEAAPRGPLPAGVHIYEIAGPLFFGAAHKATSALASIGQGDERSLILDVSAVPAMDATGIVNLQSALRRLEHAGVLVILAGLCPQPAAALTRAGWREEPGRLAFCPDVEAALKLVSGLARAEAHDPVQGP